MSIFYLFFKLHNSTFFLCRYRVLNLKKLEALPKTRERKKTKILKKSYPFFSSFFKKTIFKN